MKIFDPVEIKNLFKPEPNSNGEENGQVTIIGGSGLFHGAPIFSLKVASRFCDMVFFASPEESVGRIAEKIKSKLMSFIWIPWEDLEEYINKSDAVLIGPGFMRFNSEKKKDTEIENGNKTGKQTRRITEGLLKKFPDKRWVIDGGSLQVMNPEWIPKNAILTPNSKEFELLFNTKPQMINAKYTKKTIDAVREEAEKHNCVIVLKGPETVVTDGKQVVLVKGGNSGMTKGGTGDTLAGLTVALLAKNDPFLSACSAGFIVKKAADELFEKVGLNYNADDLADQVPVTLHNLTS